MTTPIFTREDVARELLSRRRARESLYEFFKTGWSTMAPGYQYVDGWHIGALCEHLEAVYRGQIRNLLVNAPPRTLKPVALSTYVLERKKGRVPLAQIEVGDEVLTHRGRFRRVNQVARQGALRCLRLTTFSGRSVIAAPDHPFLTPDGWVRAGNLEVGRILAAVKPQEQCVGGISLEEARLLGYLVGDGSCQSLTPNITVGDDTEAADIVHCINAMDFLYSDLTYKLTKTGKNLRRISIVNYKKGGKRARGVSTYVHGVTGRRKGPVSIWMEQHNLAGKTSYTKRVPAAVMQGSDDVVRNFLGAYWACDGHISRKGIKPNGSLREDVDLGCDSVSYDLLQDILHLMLRLGINARMRKKVVKMKTARQGDYYTTYEISCVLQSDVARFLKEVPVYHKKIDKMRDYKRDLRDFDRVLIEDKIVSIEDAGVEECGCLEVEEDHSFAANDIAVHNTLIVDVAFPAWCWLNEPTLKFIYGSYSYAIAEDASIQCRALLRSRWFRARWGDEISLSPERDTKEYFANTQGGERIISSVDGTLTGRGGDILVGNDLNRVGDEHKSSDADLSAASHFWNTVIPTRLNDPKTGRKIVVQQRTHERDISGEILDRDPDGKEWVKLILPLEFESERRCVTVPLPSTGGKPWRDPRKKDGESLIPGRMGAPEIASLKRALGSQYAISGQLQQRPAPSEGGIIKKKWFQWWKQSEPPKCEYVVLSVDTALSKQDMNAFSAATAWGVFKDDDGMANVILLMRWRERVEYPELRERMKRLSKNYLNTRDLALVGPTPEAKPPDLILIEAKANGLSLIQDLRRAGIMATPFNPDKLGDKTNRVRLVTPILEGGRVWMPAAGPKFDRLRPYADEFVEAAAMFPNAKSRDLVDTMTQALWRLQVSGWVWAKGDEGPGEAQDMSRREAFY